jgi:arsenite-transporting ATPase
VLYTGKGGVGKTTTAASAAVLAAERGVRTLVASADAAHSLGDVLDLRLGPEPREVAARLCAVEIDARVESARHWGRIQRFLVRLFVHQGIEEAVAEELALVPGAEELTTLLAIERIARSDDYDLLVLDCAPTDAALRLVTLPDVARGMLRMALHVAGALAGVTSPLARRVLAAPLPDADVFEEAEALLYLELAALHARLTGADTSARLVLTPERMVIEEARRAYTELSLFEIGCDAVVMNRLLPEAAAEEPFFREWGRIQEERVAEVEEQFAPLPVLRAVLEPDEVIGVERLAAHGRALFADAAPEALLCPARRVRFERGDGAYWVRLPLPGAVPAGLDVTMVDDDLVVSTPGRRRSLRLPRRFCRLHLAGARLEDGMLHVRLVRDAPAAAAPPGGA